MRTCYAVLTFGALFTVPSELFTGSSMYLREFFPKLERCGKDFNQIAALLLAEGSKMAQIYIGYCQGKTQSEALIIEHRPFFDRLQMQLKANESLSSYLIRPIQRITKFPLMLKVHFPCTVGASGCVANYVHKQEWCWCESGVRVLLCGCVCCSRVLLHVCCYRMQ